MSGLYTTLNSAVMALSAHSRAIEIAGKNLANVNNPEYARQRVLYGDRGTVVTPEGAQSLGLDVLAIQQLRDRLLDRQLMREIGLGGLAETEMQSYQRAQAALGQNINGSASIAASGSAASGGLSAALDDFFNAFQDLASRPTDSGARQTLLQKAAILTDRFQQTDNRLAQVQSDLNVQVATGVGEVARLLDTIADLNKQIGRFEVNVPGSAVDLRDQRQARLEELAKLLPIEVRDTGDGQLQVVAKDTGGADVLLLDRQTVTGPVTFDGTNFFGGSPATVLGLTSGSLFGAVKARDGAVQSLRDNLDTLARQIVTSVNGAYNPGNVAGEDFFDSAGTSAATITLRAGINAAALRTGTTGNAGDNSIALAVSGLATRKFSMAGGDLFDGTLGQFYSRGVSELAQALSSAQARASDQSGIAQLVRNQRDAISGVSLDEEMADLVRFQRAFQASSRVFSVVDQLLEEVVTSLGRRRD
jgi:flagellar hook-associated protein 1 FlgK